MKYKRYSHRHKYTYTCREYIFRERERKREREKEIEGLASWRYIEIFIVLKLSTFVRQNLLFLSQHFPNFYAFLGQIKLYLTFFNETPKVIKPFMFRRSKLVRLRVTKHFHPSIIQQLASFKLSLLLKSYLQRTQTLQVD